MKRLSNLDKDEIIKKLVNEKNCIICYEDLIINIQQTECCSQILCVSCYCKLAYSGELKCLYCRNPVLIIKNKCLF